MYFALWANDINCYLNTGFNNETLSSIRKSILDYVSVDQDNPNDISNFSTYTLLKMTGLELDYCLKKFKYKNSVEDEPSSFRVGKQVRNSFIR